MENQTIFIITASGDRTNIKANFKVISKEEFLGIINTQTERRSWSTAYRYAIIGDYADNVKFMSLDIFNEIFTQEEIASIPKHIITEHFRKEISEQYGTHSETKLIKPIPKKDLIPGQSYFTETGKEYFYFGHVKGTRSAFVCRYYNRKYETVDVDGILHVEIKSYHGGYKDMKSALMAKEYFYFSMDDFLKQNKKFIKIGTHKVEMEQFLNTQADDRGEIDKIDFEFLDFKK